MKEVLRGKKVAVLGLGKMGGILLRALFKQGIVLAENTVATVGEPEPTQELSRELGIPVSYDNVAAAAEAELIMLCLKPDVVGIVGGQIKPVIGPDKLLISIAASVPTRYIEEIVGKPVPVVRAMPNTPCAVGCGMIGLCPGTYANSSHLETAQVLFESTGRTVVVDESQMDAVTGLSGSGPAFVYTVLEALAEGGVQAGLTPEVALLLASQTVQGAARMTLETGESPARLREMVATPGGCTVAGLEALERGDVRSPLLQAVMSATKRAGELLPTDD